VLDWFGGEATVPELILRKKYGKAEQLLRKEFAAGRRDAELRLQLADVIAMAGRGAEAVPIYVGLADEFARTGHAPKAIAVLKKILRIAPGRSDVAGRLAGLIGDHGAGAAAQPPPPPEAESLLGPEPVVEPEPVLEAEPVPDAPPPSAAGLGPAFSSPLFGEFSREDLLAVMGGLRFLSFEPGDIIVGDGEPGDSLFVISTGRVKAFVKGPGGRYRAAREMGEGDFFGEIALLHGRPRTATVTAAGSCEMLELERGMVESLAATRPRVRAVLESFCNERVASAGG
jgi:cAMP-dependent protein kinase regulator